jgi:hypothetical protein
MGVLSFIAAKRFDKEDGFEYQSPPPPYFNFAIEKSY